MTTAERLNAYLAEVGESWSPRDREIVVRVIDNSIRYGALQAAGVDMSSEWPLLKAQLLGVQSAFQSSVCNAVNDLVAGALGMALSVVRTGLGLPAVP